MHELAVARRIVAIIRERERIDRFVRVQTVHVTLGPFTCVEPEALRTGFGAAAAGTSAEDAAMEIEHVPARGTCPACHAEQAVFDYFAACEACGTALDHAGGDDLRVARLEVT